MKRQAGGIAVDKNFMRFMFTMDVFILACGAGQIAWAFTADRFLWDAFGFGCFWVWLGWHEFIKDWDRLKGRNDHDA